MDCSWKTELLISKGDGGFCGIRRVEFIWKVVSGVVNCCIGAPVDFHKKHHKFREIIGTGTHSLESKLLHNLTEMKDYFLYEVLLDIIKSYDALDWERCMEILVLYCIRPQ